MYHNVSHNDYQKSKTGEDIKYVFAACLDKFYKTTKRMTECDI